MADLGEYSGDAGSTTARRRRFLAALTGFGIATTTGIVRAGGQTPGATGRRCTSPAGETPERDSRPVVDSAEELWRFETGDGVSSSPTVVDGTAYFGSDDGHLYAVDAEDGTRRWAVDTGSRVSTMSPTVAEGVVYARDVDGTAYALDANDGSVRWTVETAYGGRSSPTVADGTVYVGSSEVPKHGFVHALETGTGTERWRFEPDGELISSPTVVDGSLYVGGGAHDFHVYAVDTEEGTERWRHRTDAYVYASPTVAYGTVFVGDGIGNVHALDATDGTERWVFDDLEGVQSSPTVADGTVFVGSDRSVCGPADTAVYAIDARDGTERWRFETGDVVVSSPTVADGTVFVGSDDGTVYGLDASDGTPQWSFETGDRVRSSPTVVDGVVYVGSTDGNLYAVDGELEGSSEGSRVVLGSYGHHDDWRYTGREVPSEYPDDSASTTGTGEPDQARRTDEDSGTGGESDGRTTDGGDGRSGASDGSDSTPTPAAGTEENGSIVAASERTDEPGSLPGATATDEGVPTGVAGPGAGILSALAGTSIGGYLLKRRVDNDGGDGIDDGDTT